MSFGDLVGWGLGILLFVVGIPVAFWAGRRNRQVPDLRRATDFDRLGPLEHHFGAGVAATFEGRPIASISRTFLAFWNERGDHVEGSSILATDPLRIEVSDNDEVLQARVVAQSRSQIGLKVDEVDDTHRLEFDFLDPGDGGVIEVLHTGNSGARIVGTIPGARLGEIRRAALNRGARAAVRAPRLGRPQFLAPPGRRRMARLVVLAFTALGMLLASAYLAFTYVRVPVLVDASAYDLDSISGQLDFAREVRDHGGFEWWAPILPLAPALFALIILVLAIRRLYRTTTAVIPRSIVEVDFDPLPDRPESVRRRERRTGSPTP
ncbi:hypothetical protein [Agromyces binzhouensis]|uniref:hypothetical protein n=1 Tax=Agromyces binzhouensis TaxID=1817495 RepID=UPI00362635EF